MPFDVQLPRIRVFVSLDALCFSIVAARLLASPFSPFPVVGLGLCGSAGVQPAVFSILVLQVFWGLLFCGLGGEVVACM